VSDPRWACVCQPETSTALDTEAFCSAIPEVVQSPIDDYYTYVEHLLTLGRPASLSGSDTLGRLLLLGLVSGVEVYFRTVLAGVIRVCPISRTNAANQPISFGAVDYYGVDLVEWGLFDESSVASAAEIRSRTKKLLGIELPKNESIDSALREFDKLCHLRHAAVHARGTLGRGNATALEVDPKDGRMALQLRLSTLHQAGAACHSAVRAYNRFVYRRTVERWIEAGRFTGSWAEDRVRYQPLFDLFHSRRDRTGPRNAFQAFRSLASVVNAT
jgi:hypothetical protein